jgi:hypothetical protein
MKNRSRYVFGAGLAGLALGGLPGLVNRAHAALTTAADFTFETSTSSSTTASMVGPLVAEVGIGSGFGVHLASEGSSSSVANYSPTATVFSTPSGNGSTHSFSANHWGAGDYYEFDVPSTTISGVLISFDQLSSSTGPKVFSLLYSADGTNYSTYGSYTALSSVSSNSYTGTNSTGGTTASTTWSTAYSASAYNVTFDLSSITALNSDPNFKFQIVDADTTTATGGTDRIDNVVVAGTAVPEPAVVSILSMAAAATLMRRRRPAAV